MSALPVAVLAQVLQWLPLHQGMRNAALVSRFWRKASAQATTHLQFCVKTDTARALASWLKRAGQLNHLELWGDGDNYVVVDLPLARLSGLQTLVLKSLQLPDVSTQQSRAFKSKPAPLLPGLKKLKLQACKLSVNYLLQLFAGSTGLTTLVLQQNEFPAAARPATRRQTRSSAPATDKVTDAIYSLLQRQQHLQVLRLDVEDGDDVLGCEVTCHLSVAFLFPAFAAAALDAFQTAVYLMETWALLSGIRTATGQVTLLQAASTFLTARQHTYSSL